jgi:hypothetical protein
MRSRGIVRYGSSALLAAVFGLGIATVSAHAQPAKSVTDADRKTIDELQAEQKQLDRAGARVMVSTPDGRRRVTETIAKQFSVSDKVVNDLRAKKMGYGEVSIALALSQQLMRRERALTQQQALDKVQASRKTGGWGGVARDLGLKLGQVVSEVKAADKQVAKLDVVKAARAEKNDKLAKAEKVEKPEKPAKPEKVDKTR